MLYHRRERHMTSISVCMATCNGAPFLREQVASILPQLGPADELVAVDDASSDNTVTILESFLDPRIRIFRHAANQGVIRSFEHALREARGDIIFLSDQDDRWHYDKVSRVLQVFKESPEITLVMTNAEFIDGEGLPLGVKTEGGDRIRLGMMANVIRNRYRGCTMTFRRCTLDWFLPFPADIPMHDMWIGAINNLYGKSYFIDEPLIAYRRHGNNLSPNGGRWIQRIAWRWHLIKDLAVRWLERRGDLANHAAGKSFAVELAEVRSTPQGGMRQDEERP